MGRISAAVIALIAGLSFANAQTAPDKLIGTAGGGYEAFDPVSAVQAGAEAYLPFDRVGILEFSGNSDKAFIDTMRLSLNFGTLKTGDKYYGVNAGLSFNGKVVRYNGTPIPADPDPADLYTYFDLILEGDPFPGYGTATQPVGSAGAAGTATTVSRSDHVHRGDGDGGGVTAYKFFEQEPLAVTAITTDTAIPASGAGVTQTWLAKKRYSEGLIAGPFHTVYEGEIDIVLAASQTVVLQLTTVHTFSNGKTLSTPHTERFRVNADDAATIPMSAFSSITPLVTGEITLDDGSQLDVTDAILAEAVDIAITAEITVEQNAVRRAGSIKSLAANRAKVTFWQLSKTDPPNGDGFPGYASSTQPVGTASGGSATTVSRGDHAHFLEYHRTAPPVASGSGSPGTAANAARGDHYHPIPPGIAQNAARGNQNHNDINSLKTVRNPALASATAGHLVRQKSDHTVYETVSPHDAVMAGLPAITGHGGNCLKANAGATGLEFAACGGGSGGGGGGVTYTKLASVQMPANDAAEQDSGWVAGVGDVCDNAQFIAVGAYSDATLGAWQRPTTPVTIPAPGFGANGGTVRVILPVAGSQSQLANRAINIDLACRTTASSAGNANSVRIEAQWAGGTYPAAMFVAAFAVKVEGGGGGGDNPSIPAPTAGGASKFLRVNAAGAAYELAAVTPGHPFGVAGDVAALKTGASAPGTSARVARADHAHNFPSTLYGSPVAIGSANAAGTATTLARSDHVHSPGNAVATRDQLDAVQDQTDALNRLTVDLILGTPGPLSWADVNADGSEGGVARGATAGETLNNAAGLTYAAPEQTGNSTFMVVRIPAAADPRNYRTVDASEIVLTHSLNIERLIGTKDNWAYYEFPSRLASTETLTLQISGHKIGATTFDGKLGPTAASSIKGHATKLWTHTASATQWAASNGPALADGVNTAIWAGFKGGAADAWQRLELELKHTVSGSPGTDYYAVIPLATWREGGQTADNRIRIEGGAFFFGSQLRAIIHLPQPTSFNSTTGNLSIGNCSGCQGNEQIEAVLWGIK